MNEMPVPKQLLDLEISDHEVEMGLRLMNSMRLVHDAITRIFQWTNGLQGMNTSVMVTVGQLKLIRVAMTGVARKAQHLYEENCYLREELEKLRKKADPGE